MTHPSLPLADPKITRLYRIRDWTLLFENNQTKGLKSMPWVRVQTRHDGEGFRYVMAEPDGLTIYGAWLLIVQIAARCNPRGTLARSDGTPLTAHAMAIKVGWNRAADMQRALDFCSSAEVGWITVETIENTEETKRNAVDCNRPADGIAGRCNQNRIRGEEIRREERRGDGDCVSPAAGEAEREEQREHRTLNAERSTSKETDHSVPSPQSSSLSHPHNSHANRIEPKLRQAAEMVVKTMYALQGHTEDVQIPTEELDPVLQALTHESGFKERELIAVAKFVWRTWKEDPKMKMYFQPTTVFKLANLRGLVVKARASGLLNEPRPTSPQRNYNPAKEISDTERAEVNQLVSELARKVKGT